MNQNNENLKYILEQQYMEEGWKDWVVSLLVLFGGEIAADASTKSVGIPKNITPIIKHAEDTMAKIIFVGSKAQNKTPKEYAPFVKKIYETDKKTFENLKNYATGKIDYSSIAWKESEKLAYEIIHAKIPKNIEPPKVSHPLDIQPHETKKVILNTPPSTKPL